MDSQIFFQSYLIVYQSAFGALNLNVETMPDHVKIVVAYHTSFNIVLYFSDLSIIELKFILLIVSRCFFT